MKLQYGNTWWGSEWLKALEEADHANRLPRGRVYARGGAVISMRREGGDADRKGAGDAAHALPCHADAPSFSGKQSPGLSG